VRLQVSPRAIAGLVQPLKIHMDFDSGTIDAMIDRLI
jgi:hypothetical protein